MTMFRCNCEHGCTNRAEMKKHHGTPPEFEEAVWNALGEISVSEATRAVMKYRAEWAEAPEAQ